MNKTLPIRHGDFVLYPLDKLPKSKEIKNNGSYVLGEGTTTGHKHILTAKGLKVYSVKEKIYFKLSSKGKVTHEEHNALNIPAGIWELGHEREKDHFSGAVRQVID